MGPMTVACIIAWQAWYKEYRGTILIDADGPIGFLDARQVPKVRFLSKQRLVVGVVTRRAGSTVQKDDKAGTMLIIRITGIRPPVLDRINDPTTIGHEYIIDRYVKGIQAHGETAWVLRHDVDHSIYRFTRMHTQNEMMRRDHVSSMSQQDPPTLDPPHGEEQGWSDGWRSEI
jgi:hypothetical protein